MKPTRQKMADYFARKPPTIFWPGDIPRLLRDVKIKCHDLGLSGEQLLQFLHDEKLLVKAEFRSSNYPTIVRYLSGSRLLFQLATSLRRRSFLCHRTALVIHGLAHSSEPIYVNQEQSPKPAPDDITQESITTAFSNQQRQSQYIFKYAGTQYLLLSGKNTGRAGVRHLKRPDGGNLDVTDYRYNPLYNNLDAYALAYNIASLLSNLFGKGKEPFWQQAYTNLVKFIIQLHKVAYDYVTLFDVYECAINPELLESRIQEAERRIAGERFVLVDDVIFRAHPELEAFGFVPDGSNGNHRATESKPLTEALRTAAVKYERRFAPPPGGTDTLKQEILEGVKRWFYHDWRRIENKLRTSIVEGISVFLSLFDDNPMVKRTFCPPKECYDSTLNAQGKYGRPLPPFADLIEAGRVCALNFPISLNPGLAKAIGVMMKLDFQRAVLNRVPKIEACPEQHFRQVFFICDEYQHFATVGENDPSGDEKFFALSRQPKCIPIIATQSISSLKSALPGDSWRTLLQTFRTKIFLTLSDDFSARTASELCGREDRLKVNYSLSESGHDTKVSWLTGKALSHKATWLWRRKRESVEN